LSMCDKCPCEKSNWAKCQDYGNNSGGCFMAVAESDETPPEVAMEEKYSLWGHPVGEGK
jgi:hypothetical protein